MDKLESILRAGLRIADEHGLQALTMRRLAAELNSGAMTAYGYVRTKQELLDAIAALVLSDLPLDDRPDDSWQHRLERAVDSLHTVLREHPGVGQIVASRRAPIPALDRFRETLLSIFDDAGFSAEVAVKAVSALAAYAAGFAAVEHQREHVSPEIEAVRLSNLNEYPRLAAAADAYAHHVSRDAFTLGLRSLIAGLPQAAA
jgi:AcrR family transcriptional regulator